MVDDIFKFIYILNGLTDCFDTFNVASGVQEQISQEYEETSDAKGWNQEPIVDD
jgi:hypothetical protein